MKLKLLPSSFESDGSASARQHLTCFLINESVAIDAGSLAMAVNGNERSQIKDIVLTHAHLDHIAGLPLFIDDQFSELEGPIRIHAASEVIEVLERDVFNWSVYPRFSELRNSIGPVMEYREIEPNAAFSVGDLTLRAISVNHKVPCSGFIVSDNSSSIAITGDTAGMDGFWPSVEGIDDLAALLIECAFPNRLSELAAMSYHLTAESLRTELEKFSNLNCPIYAINIKPAYREEVVAEIAALDIADLAVLEVGHTYEW